MLTLSEELMLLAVNDEKGNVIFSASTALDYGLAGSIILDLFFMDRISIDDKNNIVVKDTTFVGVDFLDSVLHDINEKKKVRSSKFWIRSIGSHLKDLKELILNQLVLKGILRRSSKKLLWMIKFERYPTLNPAPELETRDHIHKAVLMDITPEEKILALISLMYSCNLINEVFPKHLKVKAKKKVKMLVEGENIGKFVSAVVGEMTVAISAAITASAIATTTASTSP